MAVMIVAIVALGIFPQPIIDVAASSLGRLSEAAASPPTVMAAGGVRP